MPAAEQYSDLTVTAETASLVASGEVDLATADRLVAVARRALDEGTSGTAFGLDPFVLDLGAVTFMDCAGLTALLAIKASASDYRRAFLISNVPECVLRILSITGLDRALELC